MPATKTSAIRVNVTPELRAELERVAAIHDVPVAHVVRRAIRMYLTDKGVGTFSEGAELARR